MNIFENRVLRAALFVLCSILFSSTAYARTELCFKKEVSDNGEYWFDANIEAEAVPITGSAYYRFTALKCDDGYGGLYGIVVTDEALGIIQSLDDLPASYSLENNDITPRVFEVEVENACMSYEGTIENIATVEGWSMVSDTVRNATDNAWIRCDTVEIGGDGCTPGYWKQPQHRDSWPVSESTLFSEIFGYEITIRQKKSTTVFNPTLLEALSAQGGNVNTAARHATAAYLNASSLDVHYDLNQAGIIDAFQTSYEAKKYGVLIENLVNFNEQGCPLN